MVDMRTYNEMHSNNDDPPYIDRKRPDLGDDFFLCLPTITFGYNMQKHELGLSVADIRDVEWNENAFELLVLEPTTKELVEAVVTHRILADEHTDLIQGKGNGLFLLLHGGPGTGKTLTAESVAEVAKRPLYRVTCGDIGTKAEEVEKYLESVLMLGKVWECVVLLDEADVFLEKRLLHDLDRNALVSVFLRVLEYYDGILILTSNRVGTFDEAFKSRIQLSLRYRDLDRDQREKIWANFITRLETLDTSNERDPNANVDISTTRPNVEVGIDTAGIRASLGKLAEYELNGREIRNAISTARQLAMFRKERMNFGHLDRVIGEASNFEEYTKELNQGFTADEISRHRGER
ncbi:aaa family ATPase [Pestalotiopsis sp. NC0098]|nr:aaa family ATPase [Pestalotiopsis sp. NC0098]